MRTGCFASTHPFGIRLLPVKLENYSTEQKS